MNKAISWENDRRNAAIDFLKAFAIIGVLTIHACGSGFQKPDSFSDASLLPSPDWIVCLMLGTVSRTSVPIFLMCTGALMLDPERSVGVKKIWTRYIPRLLAALWFWSFLYKVRHMLTTGGINAEALIHAIQDILGFKHEEYLYYIHIALLIYAFLPALRPIAAHTDKRTLLYLLVLWAVLGPCYSTFQYNWPLNTLIGIPTLYGLNLVYTSMGYTLLGWYARQYAETPWKWAAAGAAGYLSIFATTLFASVQVRGLFDAAFNATFPGTALAAAGVCGWAFAQLRRRSVPRGISMLAKASFCVYLSHMPFLGILQRVGLSALSGPCILSIPATVAAMLVCSLMVYFIVRRIPVAGNILT